MPGTRGRLLVVVPFVVILSVAVYQLFSGRGAQFGGFIGIEKSRKREERVC
jgi:hypothetical protein